MLKLKLARTGKKNQPSYRLVVQEAKSKRDGKVVEVIGNYQPTLNPPTIKIDKARFKYWTERGAQPTATAKSLYKKA